MTTKKRGDNKALEVWKNKVYEMARKGNYYRVLTDITDINGRTYLSEIERVNLKKVANINFIPHNLTILENCAKRYNLLLDQIFYGVKNADEIQNLKDKDLEILPNVGIREIMVFYQNSEPSERVSLDYMRERCLKIGELAHKNSKIRYNNFIKLFESENLLKKRV